MGTNRHHLILIGLVAAFGLSIAAFWLGLTNASSKKIGTVDMQQLLQPQSQQLAYAYPSGTVPHGVMQKVAEEIKAVIASFGQTQKITLLAKGAVLSEELPDYTEEFKQILSEHAHTGEKTLARSDH